MAGKLAFYGRQTAQCSKRVEYREATVASGASVNAVHVSSPVISMLESLYLPRVISRSGTTPSLTPPSRRRTMMFGRRGCGGVHFITHYSRDAWQLCRSRCFMDDSGRNFGILSQPSCCQSTLLLAVSLFPRRAAVGLSPSSAFLSILLCSEWSFTAHYAALYAPCVWGAANADMCMHLFLRDTLYRRHMNMKNVFPAVKTCNLSFFISSSRPFSISNINVRKCQRCAAHLVRPTLTTQLVDDLLLTGQWLLWGFSGPGGMLLQYPADVFLNPEISHPRRWGENCAWRTPILDVSDVRMIDGAQRLQSTDWRAHKDFILLPRKRVFPTRLKIFAFLRSRVMKYSLYQRFLTIICV